MWDEASHEDAKLSIDLPPNGVTSKERRLGYRTIGPMSIGVKKFAEKNLGTIGTGGCVFSWLNLY